MKTVVTLALACALGTVAGLAGWDQLKAWRAERAASQARAEAEAFAKTPEGIMRAVVEERLHDATSAVYRGVHPSQRVGGVWCGELNAKNRMGALAGFHRFIAEIQKDRDLSSFDQVSFEPTIDSDDPTSKAATFRSKWRSFCE